MRQLCHGTGEGLIEVMMQPSNGSGFGGCSCAESGLGSMGLVVVFDLCRQLCGQCNCSL